MKKYILPITFVGIGVITLAVLLVLCLFNQTETGDMVQNYNNFVSKLSDDDLNTLQKKADEYNDSKSANEYDANMFPSNTIGTITIPSIDVNLPLYDSMDDKYLETGVCHVENSALPTNKKGTHAAFISHSGLTTKTLFTNLNKLKDNDVFYIDFLGKRYTYKVMGRDVVNPDDIMNYISCDASNAYCTLITCTPVGLNTHRLLVHAKLVAVS